MTTDLLDCASIGPGYDCSDHGVAGVDVSSLPSAPESSRSGAAQGLNLVHRGANRPYILYLPAGYDHASSANVPLIVAFHGGNWTVCEFYAREQRPGGLLARADETTSVVVMPQGVGKTWNGTNCCGKALECGVDDVGFVRELITSLQTALNVDSSRIYAFGHSNGGFLVHKLAAEAPDLFAAVAAGAASVGGQRATGADPEVIAPTQPMPILMYHGTSDVSVRFEGGRSGKSDVGRFDLGFAYSVDLWLANNRCDVPPDTPGFGTGAATVKRYRGDAEVVAIEIEGHGHGLPTVGRYDHWDAVFEFFGRHAKP